MATWTQHEQQGVSFHRLAVNPSLFIAFISRHQGASRPPYESLNFHYEVGDRTEDVDRNHTLIKQALGITELRTLRQVHSSRAEYVDLASPDNQIEADALFTDRKGLALGIKVADCLPIYFFTEDGAAVGLAHAGWRGTRDRIAINLAFAMSSRFGFSPALLCYALGPCIGPDCYVVGEDVAREFRNCSDPDACIRPSAIPGKFLLDLKAVNRRLLNGLGLTEVASLDLCTHCRTDLFFSARRDSNTGRNLALIARI